YWPPPSVTTVRAFSMSAGLEASTVTPGSTAPVASFTTPVMEACANAAEGISRTSSTVARPRAASRTMDASCEWWGLLLTLAGCRERVGEAVGADAFADLLDGRAPRGDERRGPRAGQHLRILHDRLVFDRVGIERAPALGDVQRVGVRPASLAGRRRLVAAVGEPGFRVETRDVHDQRVAVPAGDGVAEVGRDDAEAVVILGQDDDEAWMLHDLEWPRRACRRARNAVRDAAQQRIVRLAEIAHLLQRRRRVEAFEFRQSGALDLAARTARRPDASEIRF